jgi:hypothetical protein
MASTSGLLAVHAEPPSDGMTLTISSDETWSDSASMDGNLVVANGATLTIEDEISIAKSNSILVEEGGTLVLTGELTGAELDAGLALNVFGMTELHLNFGDLADTGQVRINFDQTIPDSAMINVSLENSTVDAVGSDHVTLDAPLDGEDIVIEFLTYYVFEIQVVSVQALHSGNADPAIIQAENLNHTNGSLMWNSASFTMNVQGSFLSNGAVVYGADLVCGGTCDLMSTTLIGSAPVNVENGTSITVDQSTIQGSRSDEDIIVHDLAQISYTNNTGTGGITDGWIRLLSQRVIETNAGEMAVHQTGIGYSGYERDDRTDSDGSVDIGGSEFSRIVEWVDPSGIYHSEDAEVIFTLSSGWGDFTLTIDAPKTPHAVVEIPLPYIEVVSIDLEDTTADVGKKISGMVKVRNTGDASALFNMWCYTNGNLTETTSLTASLEPNEEKELPVSWWANTAGGQILNCRTLIPNVLDSIAGEITNVEGGESGEVAWIDVEESEDQPLIVFAALSVIIAVATMVIVRVINKTEQIDYGTEQVNVSDNLAEEILDEEA